MVNPKRDTESQEYMIMVDRPTIGDMYQYLQGLDDDAEPLGDDEYRCAQCREVFKKGRSDEEAKDEAKAMFESEAPASDPGMAIVCDGCWRLLVPGVNNDG